HKKTANNLEESIDKALNDLSDDSLIKPFLISNKAEVKRMCLTEYDEERTFAEQRAEGRAEGIAEGMAKGKLLLLIGLIEQGFLTLEQAANELNVTTEEFKKKASELTV
ncbi:hypothetical protein IJT10_07445, partial [bacterium]|nr:hypothetical protein [bacterium]